MVGQTLSHYLIVEKIEAARVQGEVYLAEDTKLSQKVALKILPPEIASDEIDVTQTLSLVSFLRILRVSS